MTIAKRTFKVVGTVLILLMIIFLAGRFGWKVFGFRVCQGAGIETVEVSEDSVQIVGYYPGSFPEGFCGHVSEERDGKLYVGFRFSAVFGFFETGDFDITIPVKGEIGEIILKTSMREDTIWSRDVGVIPQSEQYGVYVRLEREDVYSVSMTCDSFSGGGFPADGGAWETGKYIFMDNDIMMAAKDAEAPIPFTITVKGAGETVLAVGEFQFDADKGKMLLTVTADGRIEEDIQEWEAEPADSHTEQSESAEAESSDAEKSSALELRNVLDEINLDIQPGEDWNDMTSVKIATHLLNWGVGTDMGTEEIRQETALWLSDKSDAEQADFRGKFADVYAKYRQLLGPDAQDVLAAAGCEDVGYPWGDSPVEAIEAILEVVPLPESAVYPGADVVELVNLRGDTTTA